MVLDPYRIEIVKACDSMDCSPGRKPSPKPKSSSPARDIGAATDLVQASTRGAEYASIRDLSGPEPSLRNAPVSIGQVSE
jgi:hypothetical protein